ncbi:pyridoxamine 5'-phosphate oxidase [Ornithinimicrobium sp. Y1694]|uniref:pyridoxamine 5'-phosphate oxidase n=1 Tax=Ornithinimicrobium sp. Y1694 TaxID=3418590 RepID=UPI003CFA4AED
MSDGGTLGAQRHDYAGFLEEAECPEAPLAIVRAWIDDAVARMPEAVGGLAEPTALSVATVDADGAPDVRTVLMRDLDAQGPSFFTNTRSAKGQQIAHEPRVAAALTWPSLFRAIRFRGVAVPLPAEEVRAYFVSRPWGSRISAHASAQSSPVPDRESLEAAYRTGAERFPDTGSPDDVPVPEGWGGYRIRPDRVELWAGRPSRMHDRLVWERVADGGLDEPSAWRRERLSP